MFPVQSAQQWSLYDFEWGGGGLYCQLCSGITIALAAAALALAAAALTLTAATLALTSASLAPPAADAPHLVTPADFAAAAARRHPSPACLLCSHWM